MTLLQKELQPFDMAHLEELREIRGVRCRRRDCYRGFWEELEKILKNGDSQIGDWKRTENDEVVLGEVWSQTIGEIRYRHTVHRFSWLYVGSNGLAIGEHGHEEQANRGKQIRKVSEWYIFPDGKVAVCGKGSTHSLYNGYGGPIYVLSVKVGGKGTR